MLHRLQRAFTITAAALTMLLAAAGAACAIPADVEDHWAETAIENLIRQGVLNGYPDSTFKPDRQVTRAEFARMAVKAFTLPAGNGVTFKDTAGHWAQSDIAALAKNGAIAGYQDGTYRPENPITRAEVAAALGHLLQLDAKEQVFGENWAPSYPDVPESHQAFRLVELARRLDYLPPGYGPSFLPGAVVTRAEAAWMIDRVRNLARRNGTAIEVNAAAGAITVLPEEGDPETIQIDPEALVLRNNAEVPLEQLLAEDKVQALVAADGTAKVLKASGRVNANDLYSRLNAMTKGALTPETVSAIIAGDWNAVQIGLQNVLFDQLLKMGLSPGEAQSLLDQDWITLDLMSRDQLTSALSARLGLSTDMSAAILNRDLARVKELLQTEITAIALERLLGNQS